MRKTCFLFIFAILISLISPNTADTKTTASKQDLVLVSDYSKDFVIDLKYATSDNFVKKTLYPSPTCVLTKGTLEKLIKANNIVKKQGYTIKIWDAYRPLSVQKIMWEATPNKNYVANPYRSGSKHNMGAAVDVTLVDSKGNEVKMPTGFDDFTEKAAPGYKGMTAEQRKNLDILSKAMLSAGFKALSHEWWHFDDTDWSKYKTQDVPLSKFDKTDYTLSSRQIADLKCIRDNKSSQLILVTSIPENTSNVVISTYHKINGQWVNVLKNISGCIGVNGFTSDKTADGKKTPIGAFKIEYTAKKAKNKEGIISFHEWDAKAHIKYTDGGVATDKKNVQAIAKWLSKDKNPVILLGTLDQVMNY